MRAAIFDIDGTLLRSAAVDDALYRSAVQAVLGEVNFRTDLDAYEHVTDAGILVQVFDDNGMAYDPDLVAAIKQRFLEETEAYVAEHGPFEEIPGAREFVSTIRQSGDASVAIATGGWSETARYKLETAGFELDGVPIISSDDAIDRIEIMRIALDKLGNDFESVTYFGDGIWDEAACDALGWTFVAVGHGLAGLESYRNVRLR